MTQTAAKDPQRLAEAFRLFNELSVELADSYHTLEERVAHLNAELAEARSERTRQLAERERLARRLRSLLDALPAGVLVIDGAGRVQDANPAARGLLGEPLIGEVWRNVIGRCFAPREDDGHDVSLVSGRRLSISTCPLGDEPGQILLLHDVTETRALHERLSRHKRLSAMGEMAATLAHQIRTPLSAALLYVSHLAAPGGDAARVAGKIRDRLRELEALVADMLSFARGGGQGEPRRVETGGLLEGVRDAVEPLARAAGCSLAVSVEPAELACNPEAVLGALRNLAVNAIQAGGAGTAVCIEARPAAGAVRFGVIDDGPGIPEEVRARIFEPFFTTRSQGTGLGLAVVRAVAEAHRGRTWVEPAPGRGSAFYLELPATDGRADNDAKPVRETR